MIFERLRMQLTDEQIKKVKYTNSSSIYQKNPSLYCSGLLKQNMEPSVLIEENKKGVWGTNGDLETDEWLSFDFGRKAKIDGIALQSTNTCNYATSYELHWYNNLQKLK